MVARTRFNRCPTVALITLLLVGFTADTASAQNGPILTGSGSVNRGMGGVAVATPLSPSGALFWNPATMTGFEQSEADFGLELLFLDTVLSSRFSANSLGPGAPPVGLSGRTRTDSTVYPLPNAGLVFRPEDSRLAFGLGLHALAGFGVNYPGNFVNPALGPRPPGGVGFGPIYSDYQVLQINPAVAYQVTDRLSLAAGPNIDFGRLAFAPGLFVAPDDANGDGFATYPSAANARTALGGGFTVGAYYRADTWAAGFSYKSPQWFERYRYNTLTERGVPRPVDVRLNLPMILSWGVAYTGFERLILGVDFHYLQFSQARGFKEVGFLPSGAAAGLGFDDSFVVAVGAQYKLTNRLRAQAGYSYGTNPVPDSQSSFNVASPTLLQHLASVGVSWDVTDSLALSVGYHHGFKNTIEGPFRAPAGPVPGTSIGNSVYYNSLSVGVSVKFGPSPTRRACRSSADVPCDPPAYQPPASQTAPEAGRNG